MVSLIYVRNQICTKSVQSDWVHTEKNDMVYCDFMMECLRIEIGFQEI